MVLVCLLFIPEARTQDWRIVSTQVPSYMTDIEFWDSNTGIATGSGIWKTTNAGANWFEIGVSVRPLYAIVWLDSLRIVGAGSWGRISRSTDGGLNWTSDSVASRYYHLNNIFAVNGVLYVAAYDTLLRSTDAGISWTKQYSGLHGTATRIHFFNAMTGIVPGCTKLAKTTNGGQSWTPILMGLSGCGMSLHFINQNTGYLAGQYGAIYKTTNGGIGWQGSTPFPLDGYLWNIDFFGESGVGYTVEVGNGRGRIFKTVNHGNNWQETTMLNDTTFVPDMFAVTHTSDGHFYATGRRVVLKTINPVSVQSSTTEIPERYSLAQNYPNPFNPETTIEFSIPKKSFVALTVYDMTGRKIRTLVNDTYFEGSYEINFDATSLASGTYFYRLEAGNYTETKKMIIRK